MHTLAVSELYVRLRQAEAAGRFTQLAPEPEPVCWREFMGTAGQVETLRPDLAVRLLSHQLELSWFIEVDRATETRQRVRTKCLQYLAYWRTGIEQAEHGVFPRVLWSVPDEARRLAVASVIQDLPAPGPQLFAVATAGESVAVLMGEEMDNQTTGYQTAPGEKGGMR